MQLKEDTLYDVPAIKIVGELLTNLLIVLNLYAMKAYYCHINVILRNVTLP